jgi:predicted HicB family RNase H-like nuclease
MYSYLIQRDPSGAYAGEVLELSGCYTEGQSVADVVAKLDREVADWLDHARREGLPIPDPRNADECSGRLVLRLPKHLHARATLFAQQEGVSLNQFIMSAVAESVGVQSLFQVTSEKLQKQITESKAMNPTFVLFSGPEFGVAGNFIEKLRLGPKPLELEPGKGTTSASQGVPVPNLGWSYQRR